MVDEGEFEFLCIQFHANHYRAVVCCPPVFSANLSTIRASPVLGAGTSSKELIACLVDRTSPLNPIKYILETSSPTDSFYDTKSSTIKYDEHECGGEGERETHEEERKGVYAGKCSYTKRILYNASFAFK